MRIELTKKEFEELRVIFDWTLADMPMDSKIENRGREVKARNLFELRDEIFNR